MAFDNDTLQTEQGSAVIGARIDAALGATQNWQRKKSGDFAEDAVPEFLFQGGLDVFGDTFDGFQGDVANEAVTNHDIQMFFEEDVVAFHKTTVIEAGLF